MAGSARSRTRRNCRIPLEPSRSAVHLRIPDRSTSPACKAISTATTASTRGGRLPRSNTVRGADVVCIPRRKLRSPAGSRAWRTETPVKRELPLPFGIVTSTGSHGAKSSPCNHAAVRPEKAALDGRRFDTDARLSSGPSGKPAHLYCPKLMRLQLAPRSCFCVRPARSASAMVNVPVVRIAGMSARRAMASTVKTPLKTSKRPR